MTITMIFASTTRLYHYHSQECTVHENPIYGWEPLYYYAFVIFYNYYKTISMITYCLNILHYCY